MDPGSRIYLDTNILIKAFEGSDELSESLNRLIFLQPPAGPFAVTSALTFAELLVLPLRNQNAFLIDTYKSWSRTNAYIEVVPLQGNLLLSSAELRAAHPSLKLPDAIHLVTAAARHCRRLLSFDRRLSGIYRVGSQRERESHQIEVLLPLTEHIEALIEEWRNG